MSFRRSSAPRRLAVAGALTAASAGPARATSYKVPNFPLAAGGAVKDAVALADLNGDKTPEIVVLVGSKVVVFTNDGKPFKGFPVELPAQKKGPEATAVGAVAVGDIDGDGKPDLAVSISYGEDVDGALIAFKADGKPMWAKPVVVPGGPASGPSIGELHGKPAVFVGALGGSLVAVTGKGNPIAGFPAKLGGPASSPVAVGRFTTDQKSMVAVGSRDGKVYVIDQTGKTIEGFPLETAFQVSGAPLFADIDDDGQNELVVASQDFKVYAAKADGSAVPGYPLTTGYRIYGGAAVGDFDHDGKLSVVVASGDGKIYAWGAKGKPRKGFPVAAGKTHGSVVIGDGGRTGKDQIFMATSDGKLFGFDGAGKKLEGFPLQVGAEVTATPVLGDLDLDPSVEIVVGNAAGELHGYKIERSGEVPQSPLSWPAPGHDASRQSRFGPYPARYAKVALSTKAPRTGEALKLSYVFSDLDGDPEPATRIRWTHNGAPAPEYDGKKEIPGDKLKKKDKWKVTVQAPDDYALYKESPLATIATTFEATVADTPPGPPKVTIDPSAARTTDTLTAKVLTASTDADGDPVTYHFLWQRNGRLGPLEQTVKPGVAKRGEHWRVLVTPNDGEKDGATSDADLFIENTPPGAPEITLGPPNPTTETEIKVTIAKPASDADSDKLTYRYQFYINGQSQAFAPDRDFLPKGSAHKGDIVKAEAWAFDGDAVGPRVAAQITVVDAAPEAPKVAIAPLVPHTGDTLSSGLLFGARDPDRDAVNYRVSWTRNGQPAGQTGALSVNGAEVHKGDTWAVTYLPSDGALDGPPASAQVTVVNSLPTKPRVAVSDASPALSDSVKVFVTEASRDADGDTVRYEYKWSVEEEKGDTTGSRMAKMAGASALLGAANGDKTQLTSGEFHKHQRILVAVTPIDSDNARGPTATVEILPRNTPPTTPFVNLEPKIPTTETGLKVALSTPATDADNDALTYHYKWYRDGVLASDVGDRAELKAGEVKHGEQWRVIVRASDGEAEGPSAEATTIIRNVTPAAPVISISPAQPTTVTGVTCQTTTPAKDADGDPLTLHYTWLRDGQPYSIPDSADSVPGNAIKNGQNWTCQVVARDAEATSVVATAAASIIDAAPSAPKITVEPKVAKAGDGLTCAIEAPALDPDGDRVKYEFKWTGPKGAKLPKLDDPARIPAGVVKKGQAWTCSVVATDGRAAADAVSAQVKVGNTAPLVAELTVEPWGATPGQDLTCSITKQASDVDGDPISYAFTWSRNGAAQAFATTSSSVPGRLVKAGDKWSCSAVPNDGEEDGPSSTSAEMTVVQGATEEE
jgi:hypothetical protein